MRQSAPQKKDEFYTLAELSLKLKTPAKTIRKWIKYKHLRALRLPSNRLIVEAGAFQSFLRRCSRLANVKKRPH